jgi:hypothetical protein
MTRERLVGLLSGYMPVQLAYVEEVAHEWTAESGNGERRGLRRLLRRGSD